MVPNEVTFLSFFGLTIKEYSTSCTKYLTQNLDVACDTFEIMTKFDVICDTQDLRQVIDAQCDIDDLVESMNQAHNMSNIRNCE